jgi:hypothetical protein
MSIDRKTFENATEEELSGRSNPERVLIFLVENADRAFKPKRIADGADVGGDVISTVLSRLEERGLVVHKGPYWAVTDLDRLRSHGQYERVTERLNERLGREDKEAWREHAPDEPYPNEQD